MSVSITVDTKGFSDAVRRLSELPRSKPVEQIIKAEGRLFVRDVIKITPPFRSYQTRLGESLAENRRAGNDAIEKQLKVAFSTPQALIDAQADPAVQERMRKLIRANKLTELEQMLYNLSGNKRRYQIVDRITPQMHKAARDSRGRVRGFSGVITTEKAIKQRTKEAQANVGIAKSGWVKAARALGASVPGWISRHSGSGVYKEERASFLKGFSILIGNAVAYIQKRGAELQIIKDALKLREQSLNNRIRKAIEHQAKRIAR